MYKLTICKWSFRLDLLNMVKTLTKQKADNFEAEDVHTIIIYPYFINVSYRL